MWQPGGERVVVVVEVLCQEEVAVGVILVGAYLELCRLHSALRGDGLGLGVLLRDEAGDGQLAELELGLHAEEGRTAAYEARPGGHAYVAGLYVLDYFVFLPLVGELEVLGVEVERGVGVVGHVELHLVAHRGVDVGLDFLVEVEESLAAVAQREGGIVGLVALYAERELRRTGGGETHAAGAEHLVQRAQGEVHVQDVEGLLLLLLVALGVAPAEVTVHLLAVDHGVVLLRGHEVRGHNLAVADLCADYVHAEPRVVFGGGLDVLGRLEVRGVFLAGIVLVIARYGG